MGPKKFSPCALNLTLPIIYQEHSSFACEMSDNEKVKCPI